jgi:cellulose synthase/poly-beta-1,6-N-acetylglucosamine synthase-like glycosyltransferase
VRWLIPFLYTAGLILVTLYAVGQLHLLYYWARYRTRARTARPPAPCRDDGATVFPRVTVQLPVFNERFVAAGAIDALAELHWPADRLEIQVLDDSTDDTAEIIATRVARWRARGIDIRHIRRADRRDFKAGALAAGLKQASGEYVAIFDADFRPAPDYLRRTMPYVADPSVGFVQARWGHRNRTESVLTRIEATLLDVPFLVGQPARAEAGFFLRFNGSAGIWRRACIEQAGGWSADTLAEDLDLCFRAQLAGWRARYAADVVVDAELPRRLEDFRRQQSRWIRGTAQVIRKLGRELLVAPVPGIVKAHAWLDLLTVIAVLPVLVTAVLSVPMAWMLHAEGGALRAYAFDTSFALLPVLVWMLSVLVVACHRHRAWWKRCAATVGLFFPMLVTMLGLSLSLGAAAVAGFWHWGGEFVRTPKFGKSPPALDRSRRLRRRAASHERSHRANGRDATRTIAGELLMLVYFLCALLLDVRIGASEFLPLHTALVCGCILVLIPVLPVRSPIGISFAVRAAKRQASRLVRTAAGALAGLLLHGPWNGGRAAAQTSLVPAQHPAYEWLHRQRVLGRVDRYAHGALPLTRAQIAGHLAGLAAREDLRGTDRALLATYRREFSAEGLAASANENLLRGPGNVAERVGRILRGYGEPHVFAAVEEGYGFAFDLMQSFEQAWLDEGRENAATLISRGVRAFADFYGHVGLHLEAGNIEARGDREVLPLDPLYGKTFEVVRQGKNNSNYFEAFVSARYGVLGAHLGHGALRVGPGPGESLWLSRDASKFDWIRLDIDTRYFRYIALHGAPASDAEGGQLILDGADTARTRVAPNRWLAVHRLEVLLSGELRLALTEMIAYSARGVDLAYINPVSPLFFSELDNHDRDNAVLGLDLTWRPVAGLELHGGVLVDDATEEADIIRPSDRRTDTRAFDVGVTSALSGGLDAGARYVRLEPFVYAHHQALNALEQRGFPLGNALGPNADAWQLWARLWLPRRTAVMLAFSRSRKGLNPIDAEGQVIENVGGDFIENPVQQPYRFLEAADVQRWQELGIEADTEPWRGFRFSLRGSVRDVRAGHRVADRTYLDVRLRIGF